MSERNRGRPDPASMGRPPRPHGPRNRRRWCRGRVGTEHRYGCWRPGFGPHRPELLDWAVENGDLVAWRECECCGRLDYHYKLQPLPVVRLGDIAQTLRVVTR